MSLPILIPTIMTIAFVRLSLESRKSRSRIKALENHDSYRERLVQVVGQMEKRVEDVVVEYMDDPAESVPRNAEPSASGHNANATPGSSSTLAEGAPGQDGSKHALATVAVAQTVGISALQRRMAKSLNTLPNLEKRLVFIDLVLNSHAVIIARDVKRFKHHRRGHGVLEHLADNLVL